MRPPASTGSCNDLRPRPFCWSLSRSRSVASLAIFNGERRIVVNENAPIERLNFAIAELTARLYLMESSWFMELPEMEQLDLQRLVAANMLAPRRAYLKAMGEPIEGLAARFAITCTSAMMRIG